MFCKNCGSEITGNMRFCNNCGTELPPPEVSPADNMYPPQNVAQPQNVAVPPYAPPGQFPPQNMAGPGQFPPPPQKKGASTGLIITAIAIAMVVIIGGVLLFVFRDSIFGGATPTPTPTPSRGGGVIINPGNTDTPTPTPQQPPSGGTDSLLGAELEGSWINGSGDWIWYFHEANNVKFILTGDGMGRVQEDEWGEWGDWWIDDNGYLHIVGDDTEDHDIFTYSVIGNTLTVFDEDGDKRTYTRGS